jgi:hypothetical protein
MFVLAGQKTYHQASGRLSPFLAVALVFVGLWLSVMAPSASADPYVQDFCSHAWVGPYGQSNDSCAAGDKHYNFMVEVIADEHSACIATTTNTNKSGLNSTWDCTAGAYQATQKWVSPKALTNGIFRNNTAGSANHASGRQTWCSVYNCGQ